MRPSFPICKFLHSNRRYVAVCCELTRRVKSLASKNTGVLVKPSYFVIFCQLTADMVFKSYADIGLDVNAQREQCMKCKLNLYIIKLKNVAAK